MNSRKLGKCLLSRLRARIPRIIPMFTPLIDAAQMKHYVRHFLGITFDGLAEHMMGAVTSSPLPACFEANGPRYNKVLTFFEYRFRK